MIEAIQQAAEDNDYTYNSSWFPWNETSKDYAFLVDQKAAEDEQEKQQQQPGVMVFRRALRHTDDPMPYESGLIVFVVAEQPTGGVDGDEFQNALQWIARLGALTPKRGLKILGPTFSGSLPSLARELSADRLKDLKFQVSSGSVSSEMSYHWFQKLMGTHLEFFRTAVGGDNLMVDRLLQYLSAQGYPLNRVALVSEDETAFGRTSSENRQGDPIYLYYPRDIATLRSAYEQQSILNSSKPANSSSTSTTLRGDLSEPTGSDHDTVRSYGGQLMPLAQESVLLNIVRVLKEKKIEFVVLRSTNTLDQIFLTQFLRRSYPGGRIVIDGADLLFERGAEGTSLRGVMMVSTYPLIAAQQEWTRPLLTESTGSYRIFGQDVTEGLYIAARELLADRVSKSKVPIANYAAPAWAQSRSERRDPKPSTWISVIGRHQFWPIAVLNEKTSKVPDVPDMPPSAAARGDAPAEFGGEHHPLRIDAELIVMLILCSAWTALHCVWCRRASVTPFPDAFRLTHFAPVLMQQHPALIVLTSLLPAMAAVVMALASGVLSSGFAPGRQTVLVVWALLTIAASIYACRSNYSLVWVRGSSITPVGLADWRRRYSIIAVIAFVLFVLMHGYMVSRLDDSNAIPAYWRSVHVFSGVSPLLPQILLILGMYVWAWFNLRGLSLFADDRPLLPALNSLPAHETHDGITQSVTPMFSQEKAAQPIEEKARPLNPRYLILFLIILVAAFIVFTLMLDDYGLRTLGEKSFGVMMLFWVTVCIALVLADTVQLWIVWSNLRRLLVYLDRLPLRRTLASLGGLSWGSVWAMSGNTLEERYRLTSRELESLRHLYNQLVTFRSKGSAILDKIEKTRDTIDQFMNDERLKFVDWYLALDGQDKYVKSVEPLYKFQKALAATAGAAFSNILLPAWQLETRSLLLKAPVKDSTAESDEAAKAEPCRDLPPHVMAAEEFFILPYIGFIQNMLARIRTIVLGSLFLFVAATLAASSYPFDPLPTVGGIFLAVFVITGGTIAIVFAQMHRDATLSHITNTLPGQLGGQFWLHLITFGVGPLLGLLTTLFPSITDFVTSWLQPGVQALK